MSVSNEPKFWFNIVLWRTWIILVIFSPIIKEYKLYFYSRNGFRDIMNFFGLPTDEQENWFKSNIKT
jgi:hypothetical protein